MSTQPSKPLNDNFRALLVMLVPPQPASASERVLWDQKRHGEPTTNGPEVVSEGIKSYDDITYPSVDNDDNDEASDNEGYMSSNAGSESGYTYETESDHELMTPIDDDTESMIHGLTCQGLDDDKNASEGFNMDDPNRAPATRASLRGASQDFLVSTMVTARDPDRLLRTQGYLWPIAMSHPKHKHEVTLSVIADTGSGYLWVYGDNYVELVGERRHPWAQDGPRVLHTVLPNTGFDGVKSLERDWNPSEHGVLVHYQYMDGSAALTGALYPLGVDVQLYGYNFTTEKNTVISLLDTHLGVALAVDTTLGFDKSDGMLGLGADQYMLSRYYFPDRSRLGPSHFPSILSILRDNNELLPTKAGSHDRFIMFITLRLPAQHYQLVLGDLVDANVPVQSWIAFNRWPLEKKPTWSPRIALVPPQPGHPAKWLVRLESFTVQRCTTRKRPDPEATRYGDWHVEWKNGYNVLLDTGCSTSRIDESVLEYIQEVVFKRRDPIRRDTEHERFSYNVPSNFDYSKFQVRLVFTSIGGGSVAVYLPFHPFVVTHNVQTNPPRLEPVFFRSRHPGKGTFGLNFFQSAFVSFRWHKDEVKSVRMAPQIFEDFKSYHVNVRLGDDDDDD